MGLSYYNSDEWRLFIDSSRRSLKCVLLCKGNQFACVPIGHSVVVKEHHLNVKMVLNKLGYNEHNYAMYVDFKMVNFLLGQQGRYTKHSCSFCYRDSTGRVGWAEKIFFSKIVKSTHPNCCLLDKR